MPFVSGFSNQGRRLWLLMASSLAAGQCHHGDRAWLWPHGSLAAPGHRQRPVWCQEKRCFEYGEALCRYTMQGDSGESKSIKIQRSKSRGRREGAKDHQTWGGTAMTIMMDCWAGVSLLLCVPERGRFSLPSAGRASWLPTATLGCSPGLFRTMAVSGGWSPLPPERSTVAPTSLCQLSDPPPGTDCIPVPSCRRASGAPGGILDVESILIAVSIALLQRAQEQFWSKSWI